MTRSQRQARIQLLEALYDEAVEAHDKARTDRDIIGWLHTSRFLQAHLVAARRTTSP